MDKDMMIMKDSLIWSEVELKKFYDEIINNERAFTDTDFFCLASRRKYLTEEEKAEIKMGDTVFLCKTVLKDYNWPKFLSKIRQADAMADYVLDSNDNYIPRKCFVMYMNVNHTNVIKAIKEFKETMACWDADALTLLEFSSPEKKANLCRQYKSCTEGILKAFQNPKNGEDIWIDLDCDLECDEAHREDLAKMLINHFQNMFFKLFLVAGKPVHAIITHGGIHLLINKGVMSMYNSRLSESGLYTKKEMKDHVLTPERVLTEIRMLLADVDSKEIVINPNKMVPIPGTLQGGFKVRMLD